MPINLNLVPQVIPHSQYLEHLDGASTSSEDTVRLFASLSLARSHPDVTTWAAVAEALNMPGPTGVRCARASSASMLVGSDEWKNRIWRAGEETERRDYRATEAKIHHRLGMTRWFKNGPAATSQTPATATTTSPSRGSGSTSPTPTSTSHQPGEESDQQPRTAPTTASSPTPSMSGSRPSSATPYTSGYDRLGA